MIAANCVNHFFVRVKDWFHAFRLKIDLHQGHCLPLQRVVFPFLLIAEPSALSGKTRIKKMEDSETE